MTTLELVGFGYLLTTALISVVTFVVYGFDKRNAIQGGRRVPESRLHQLAFFGGWPGALLGRRYFRHKKQKALFTLKTALIVAFHCVLISAWVWIWMEY